MSKQATIEALLASAQNAFSHQGFAGASLRAIAERAGVALGTVSLYFPSKTGLFAAVGQRALDDLTDSRQALLEEALARHGGGLPLEEVVRVLARPVVELALAGDTGAHERLTLLRGGLSKVWPDVLGSIQRVDRFVERLLAALAQACPGLSRADQVWALSYVVGVVYSWQLVGGRYDAFLQGPSSARVEEVTEDIVAFASAGVRALAARRRPPAS